MRLLFSRAPRARLVLYAIPILAGAVLAALIGSHQVARHALAEDAQRGSQQLALYANNLQTLIERYRALPAVLALDPQLRRALSGPVNAETQAWLNLKLETINSAARSSILELLDRNGLAVAASNWRLPSSYVGHDYAFRPYFTESRDHGTGRFYAVGVTSGIPGYFLSHAIFDDQGQFIGSMVVKLEFPRLEEDWNQSADVLLVSDNRGVVFIANKPSWRYRLLRPLSATDQAELSATRQYDNQPLLPLAYQTLDNLAPAGTLAKVEGLGASEDYVWNSQALPAEDWTLHLLHLPSDAREDTRNAAMAGTGGWLALVFLGLFLQQRWRIARLHERNRLELEQLVDQRTEALRTAQEGLVQSAKLAALGQMSAALAHEINQPLTAQRMHLASLGMLLGQGRLEEAQRALQPLDQQLTRMAALTRHLKIFARQSPVGLREKLDLAVVVDQALSLLQPRIEEERVHCQLQLRRPAWVCGDAIRLEQVVINVLRNALDAMGEKTRRLLQITLRADGAEWQLTIEDSGGGIASEHLGSVFVPFFTTKPVGEGLGLGLAISYGIVHETGGRLEVHNGTNGACFTLTLPIDTGSEPAC